MVVTGSVVTVQPRPASQVAGSGRGWVSMSWSIGMPVRSLIILICWHTESTLVGSVPVSEIRAFAAIRTPP